MLQSGSKKVIFVYPHGKKMFLLVGIQNSMQTGDDCLFEDVIDSCIDLIYTSANIFIDR
jgi:hypothetical protein